MADLFGKRFPCPHCGGSKSLAKYDDGEYCFKCGKDTRKENSIFATQSIEVPSVVSDFEKLPLSKTSLDFLAKYEIYSEPIELYKLCDTTEYGGRLAMPVWDNDNIVIFCQFRDVTGTMTPKTISKGPKPLVFYTEYGLKRVHCDRDPVVIVEDPFSAIKVAMAGYQVFCLYGSSLKRSLLPHFTKMKKPVILWLDGDQAGIDASAKISNQLKLYTQCIINFTPEDPKCYSKNEIREFLGHARYH